MTDETFISEKSGKRYKVTSYVTADHGLKVIEEIIEPKLEVGDWIKYPMGDKNSLGEIDHEATAGVYQGKLHLKEIRKASGEVWKKINGEWQLTTKRGEG